MADGLQALETALKNLTSQVTKIGTRVTKTGAEVGIIKKVGLGVIAIGLTSLGFIGGIYYQLGSLNSDVESIKSGQAQQARAADVQQDLSEIRELLLRALPPEEVQPEPMPPADDGSKK